MVSGAEIQIVEQGQRVDAESGEPTGAMREDEPPALGAQP
jgi:hypothetical protein